MNNHTTRTNRDYVAQRKNWTSIVVDTAVPEDFDGRSTELTLYLFERFREAFQGLMTVTELEVVVKQKDPMTADDALGFQEIEGVDNPITVQNPAGVTGEDITQSVSDISIDDGMELYIGGIEVTDSQARVYLEDGFVTIDTSTEDRYRFVPVLTDSDDTDPPSDPVLSVEFGYRPIPAAFGYDRPILQWRFITVTDLWFEESPIGEINRARLHECFERLGAELEILDTRASETTVGVNRDDVEDLFEYDGPSSKTLIERHRAE